MFGFGKDKKKEEAETAKEEQVSQAMRSMSDQLAQKGKEISELEDQLDDAKKDAAAKAQAEKELAAARAELARMKAETARAQAQAQAATAAAAKAQAEAAAAKLEAKPAPSTVLGGAASAPAASAPAATPAAAPAAAPGVLAPGVSAWVRKTGGKNLRLRDKPGLESNAFAGLPPGTQMTILEGPIQDDGYPWWRIRVSDGREGWVAGTELVTSPE
jgi:hypothetical protein